MIARFSPLKRFSWLIGIILLAGCGALGSSGPALTPTRIPPVTAPYVVVLHTSAPTPRPTETPSPAATATPSLTRTPEPTSTPTASPVPMGVRVWAAESVPTELIAAFDPLVASKRFIWVNEKTAQVKLDSTIPSPDPTPEPNRIPLAQPTWVYVPVAPFPTLAEALKWADIQAYWGGSPDALAALSSKPHKAPTLVVSPPVLAWLKVLLGDPASGVDVSVVPADGVAATLMKLKHGAWSIVPFQQLDPAEKVLTLDGLNVLTRDFSVSSYPLKQTFSLSGLAYPRDQLESALSNPGVLPVSNRDPDKMTILVMSGTTALTRATAYAMETNGITLPARDIAPFLADADIVHTSNEVSFSPTCPYPDPNGGMTFCSKDSYFDLLSAIHLTVVELTGNHVNDWGRDALSHTLDRYDASHILHFGGGRNTEDARAAAILTHNGTSIAFIGCNPVGPSYAWATDTQPGSAVCDDDFLSQEIPRLKKAGNLVIMTLQYQEYYTYETPADQVAFFHKYAAMGADIVFGSQAHHPQGFAFDGHTFMVYGTGNLFFDQMDDISTRQMFIDKLILYNGVHISTVLFTGINEDYSRPRPMTEAERADFLTTIFEASGW